MPEPESGPRAPGSPVTRREFLEASGAAALAWSAAALTGCGEAAAPQLHPAAPLPASPAFLARYRQKWTWDGVVRGTHNLNCWYQQSCCFHVFTRDGKVVREEQVGDYPQTSPDLPDFNPRGCQKGCSYSELMYSAPRVQRPLRRAGERGEGKWREVSWDEALAGIADEVLDTIGREGTEAVVLDPGGNGVAQIFSASMARFADALDCTVLDVNCELGDDQQGAAVTFGEPQSERSGDDYFHSDLILIWGGNPAYTQIPNFHFLTEARWHGTTIVAISPDLNASAIHADQWVPIKPGTDAALALSMAKVVLDEGLHAESLIREQTDLPLLVCSDTRKLLRESDLRTGGSDRVLYRWDLARGGLEAVSLRTLALGGCVPALEGRFTVATLRGEIEVRPVLALLRERLEAYAPERAAEVCGVPAATIVDLARQLARAKAATNTCTSGISKLYHGDLIMRAQILLFVLCGHLGRPGAGYVGASYLLPDGKGIELERTRLGRELLGGVVREHGARFVADALRHRGWRAATIGLINDGFAHNRSIVNSTLFWNLHGGLLEVSGRRWDVALPREPREYVGEALRRGWQPYPEDLATPRVLIVGMGNPLRRVRGAHRLREVLWPKLRAIVALEMRMSSTALWADWVLPVAGAYEKTTVISANTNPLAPFVHTTRRAVDPVGESRDEWQIVSALGRTIAARAAQRGWTSFRSRYGFRRRYDRIVADMTDSGCLAEGDGEALSRTLVEDSTNLSGATWEQMKDKGYARFSALGKSPLNWGNACDIRPGETIAPHGWHTERKLPWATLSGRIQLYIDHDWYLELGEELPAHKPPPKAGGDWPLVLTGGHARWSIHATWRADPILLRLQRGEPCMWVSLEDARERGIADGDRIEVRNDVGRFVTRAKLSPAVRPGQVILYHAWEDYQFEGGQGYRNVLASPINPVELVGDYPFLKPVGGIRQLGQSDRDTRVQVEKLS